MSNFWEFRTRIQVDSAVASGWELDTSLVRAIDGVIFKAAGDSTITHYLTTDYSWTATTITVDSSAFTGSLGAINWAGLYLRQTRDDPLNYDPAEAAHPTIVGWMNDDFIFVFTYDSGTLTMTNSIAVPCSSTQVAAGCDTERAFITLLP